MELEATALYLKSDNGESYSERLLLPRSGTALACSLDEYLSTIPRVVSRADEFMADCCDEDDDEDDDPDDDNNAQVLVGPLALPHFLRALLPRTKTTPSSSSSSSSSSCSLLYKASHSRCLYVLQGEVAHVSALQADLVISADATTCHVVALRSTSTSRHPLAAPAPPPLVSVAHVADCHAACLERMLLEHVRHHHEEVEETATTTGTTTTTTTTSAENVLLPVAGHDDDDDDDHGHDSDQDDDNDYGFYMNAREDEKMTEAAPAVQQPQEQQQTQTSNQLIEMELHMLGGFLDKNGASPELSTSLITTFSKLADKYQDKLRICLSTAAISCLNTTTEHVTRTSGTTAPKSRGLGIDIHTGQVFSVKHALPSHLKGPAWEIRSARALFGTTTTESSRRLNVIHDCKSVRGEVRVEPFHYRSNQNIDLLLQVPDDVLLKHTSTSPEHESGQFCSNFRRTLSFVNTVPPERVFGQDCSKSLVYTRLSNEWPHQNEWSPALL